MSYSIAHRVSGRSKQVHYTAHNIQLTFDSRIQFIHTCNENTVVKPPFVLSRRIPMPAIGDTGKMLCAVSGLQLRTWVSVPDTVAADSKRRKCISTLHG